MWGVYLSRDSGREVRTVRVLCCSTPAPRSAAMPTPERECRKRLLHSTRGCILQETVHKWLAFKSSYFQVSPLFLTLLVRACCTSASTPHTRTCTLNSRRPRTLPSLRNGSWCPLITCNTNTSVTSSGRFVERSTRACFFFTCTNFDLKFFCFVIFYCCTGIKIFSW